MDIRLIKNSFKDESRRLGSGNNDVKNGRERLNSLGQTKKPGQEKSSIAPLTHYVMRQPSEGGELIMGFPTATNSTNLKSKEGGLEINIGVKNQQYGDVDIEAIQVGWH